MTRTVSLTTSVFVLLAGCGGGSITLGDLPAQENRIRRPQTSGGEQNGCQAFEVMHKSSTAVPGACGVWDTRFQIL